MTIFNQIGNIGSEITRARVWQEKGDSVSRDKALERALRLIDAALLNQVRPAHQRELACLRALVATAPAADSKYLTILRQLENYCLPFALLARKNI